MVKEEVKNMFNYLFLVYAIIGVAIVLGGETALVLWFLGEVEPH